MSSGGYTTERCCLRMGAGERNHSQFPISILHSQMHEIWEVNECFLQVSLTIMGSSIFFSIQSEWASLNLTENLLQEIIWRYITSPCYFSFLLPSFVSKIPWLFQSHRGCKLKFHLDTALDTHYLSACACSLQCKGFLGDRKNGEIMHLCFSSKQGIWIEIRLTW